MNCIGRTFGKGCSSKMKYRPCRTARCSNATDHRTTNSKIKPFEDVPGPKPIPILGSLWKYLPVIGEYSFKNLHKAYESMYQQYGPLVKEQMPGNEVLLHVFDPDDMLTVYANSGKYPMRRSHDILAKYRRERPHIYKNTGLFPSNGEEWYRFRQLFQKILLHTNTAQAFVSILEDITEDLVARVHLHSDDKNEIDFLPELFKWAVECVGAITLNRRLGCLSEEDNEEARNMVNAAHATHRAVYLTETLQFLKSYNTRIYKNLVEAQDCLSGTVDKYMKEAMLNPETLKENYLLSRLFEDTDADYKDIFTMIADMFLAGIDTTAYTTGFALYNLCKNPSVQEKLRQDLIHYCPKKTTRLSENLESVLYLHSVVRESLRINPVAIGNGRVLPCETVLSGYKVPANVHIILQHQTASLQNENYPDAKVFDPERWRDPAKTAAMAHPVTSTAFGFGSRTCVGKRFAQREMLLGIAKLVRNFKIEYHYEDIDFHTQLINVPSRPFRFRFIPLEN